MHVNVIKKYTKAFKNKRIRHIKKYKNESRFANFAYYWLPWQRLSRYRKMKSSLIDLYTTIKYLTFGDKNRENRSSRFRDDWIP